MKTYQNTRVIIIKLSSYVSGKTLDFGAGSAKYQNIIKPHTTEYVTFDMMPGDKIDVVGDALNPPFEDESFDTIISTQMLEHVSKPWLVVSQMKRVLKPNGICIVTAPFLVPYHADPHDFFRYTKQGMESLFEGEGFTVLESGCYGNTPSVLAEMFHFAHFSHYKKRTRIKQRLRDLLINTIKLFAFKLDSFFHNESVYANTYVVAHKENI